MIEKENLQYEKEGGASENLKQRKQFLSDSPCSRFDLEKLYLSNKRLTTKKRKRQVA